MMANYPHERYIYFKNKEMHILAVKKSSFLNKLRRHPTHLRNKISVLLQMKIYRNLYTENGIRKKKKKTLQNQFF